jgi:uncharacterized protein (DUF2267 family)
MSERYMHEFKSGRHTNRSHNLPITLAPVVSQFQPGDFIARRAEHRGVRRTLDARGELSEVFSVMCNEVDLHGSMLA